VDECKPLPLTDRVVDAIRAPEHVRAFMVVAPPTPSAPPSVTMPVTPRVVANVAAPPTPSVPTTPRVDPIVAAPVIPTVAANVAAPVTLRQGLTLVHFSAQLGHFLWNRECM